MLLHCNTSYDSLVEGGVNEGKILRQERLNLFYLVDGCWLDGLIISFFNNACGSTPLLRCLKVQFSMQQSF